MTDRQTGWSNKGENKARYKREIEDKMMTMERKK